MSLYLKYRPQDFSSIFGQNHIVQTLRNAVKNNGLTHAYLFCGPRGTGKTSLARIVAKSLSCTNLSEGVNPCNSCDMCAAINKGQLVDLIEIDAASNRGIDEIRELREKIQFAPNQAKAKVYIIDEVHMLTKEAFNALLKTLEEPPTHAYFILATTESHKIPETIISRCQQFNFKRIGTDVIVDRLEEIAKEESINAEPDALKLIAKASNGGLRDAIGLFEQLNVEGSILFQEAVDHLGLTGSMMIESFYDAVSQKQAVKAIDILSQLNNQGHNLAQFCGEWIAFLREQMLLGLKQKADVTDLMQWIDYFSEAKQKVNQSVIPLLPLEMAVIKACNFEVSQSVSKPKTDKRAETPKAETKKVDTGQSLSIDEVKSKWQRVLDQIETPFIRMSLADGEPVKLDSNELVLEFRSSTLMDKVMNPQHQADIHKATDAVLGQKFQISGVVKQIEITTKSVKVTEKPEPSAVEMAKEVFGN